MAGAVAVGMFGNAALAGVIMAAHYLGALCTGVCLKFYRGGDPPTPDARRGAGNVAVRALAALVEARRRDGRPFGQLLGDAVRESVNTLLLVGGFVILFSVIIELLGRMGFVGWASAALAWGLSPLGIGPQAARSLISGFFEITIGAQAAAQSGAPLLGKLVLVNMIIAWSGLSVLGQVAAVTQGTGVSMLPYVGSRVLHAIFAGVLTVLLWNPAAEGPAVQALASAAASGNWIARVSWAGMLETSAAMFAGVVAALAVGLAAWCAWCGLRVAIVRLRP